MRQKIEALLRGYCESVGQAHMVVELSRPDSQFGDYSTNIALQLAKPLGKNPREVAADIQDVLHNQGVACAIAGPGFLNITLTDEQLLQSLEETPKTTLTGQTILVEYSDPNPLKPLHAGHLYTTLVGDVIARLIERHGARTIRLNYGGDVGLHVAKSMWAITNRLGGETPEKLSDISAEDRASWLGECYVEGNNAYEDDESAKASIIELNKRVYQLHESNDNDSAFAQLYWTVREWSYDYFQVLYENLQVHAFDRYIPESEVTPLGIEAVKKAQQAGVFSESDSAVVFAGEDHGLHTRVFINSQGLPTYETKDIGLALTKWRDYQFDRSIIITANEQAQYMQVVLKALEFIEPEPAHRTTHITHGVVKLTGGVKMSSRKGNVVTALEILDAARIAGAEKGSAKTPETVLAAVKYAFLRQRIGSDIIYDPLESVAMEGNSGPYLQYAHARACSIVRKSPKEAVLANTLTTHERLLARKLSMYNEAVTLAATELLPHHICTYLYDLAQTFNRFYEHEKVVGHEREAHRIALVSRYQAVLKDGLELLGIHAPDSM